MNWISPFVGIVLGALWFTSMAHMSDDLAQPVQRTELRPAPPPVCCTLFDETGRAVSRGTFDPQSMRFK